MKGGRLKRTISFSLELDEYEMIERCARSIGLTISQFCKTAAFSHRKRYAVREKKYEERIEEICPPSVDIPNEKEELSSSDRLRSRKGYVYLVKSGNYYKIGVTRNNPHKRLEGMMKLPATAVVVNHLYVDWPYKVEAELHKKYAEKRVNGEWFVFDDIPEEFT